MTRLSERSMIEARLLELAHTTDAKITAPALAYFAPCSIEDASRVLEDLAAHDRLTMQVEDDGTIVYEMPGRQKLSVPQRPYQRPMMALAPMVSPPVVRREASPLAAAVLSAFVPGAGHLYAGRVVAALLWFLVVGVGYALIIPGLVLHLFAIASSAVAAHQLNAGQPPARLQLAPSRW